MSKTADRVYRFEVKLLDTDPAIWRLIEVPGDYTFWDLHVAIQDAMGWIDYHLHEFTTRKSLGGSPAQIGITDEDAGPDVQPGWKFPISLYFKNSGDACLYEYDFGDGWEHEVTLVAVDDPVKGVKYPRCVGGERACPPEDCGGVGGYYELLEILQDPSREEHEEMSDWLQGHPGNYHPYRPEHFDLKAVKFTDPRKRLKKLLEAL